MTVTATLTKALSGSLTIPVLVMGGSTETGDIGTLTGIDIASGATSGTGEITTARDADRDDEMFTVRLGALPSTVRAGAPASVDVTIRDADAQGQLVWSASFTTGRSTIQNVEHVGCIGAECGTRLTDDDFVFDGVTYRVTGFWQDRHDRTVFLTLDKAFPDGLKAGTLLRFGNWLYGPSQATYSDQGRTAGWSESLAVPLGFALPVSLVLSPLSVDATPACGSAVTDMSVEPERVLTLSLGRSGELATESRMLDDDPTTPWGDAFQPLKEHDRSGPFITSMRSPRSVLGTFAELRQAHAGFAGFEHRLKDFPDVTARCTWRFQGGGPDGPGGPGGPGGPPPPDDDEDDDDPPPPSPPPPPPPADDGPPVASFEQDGAECDGESCRAVAGGAVRFLDTSTGRVVSRRWDFGDGRRSGAARAEHSWSEPGFYRVTLVVSDGEVESTASLTFLVEAAVPAGACVADDETRCLGDSRFAVGMEWWTAGGEGGPGKVVREGTNDSALFRFFEPGDNWEVLVKVLDGCSVNGHVWVFGASTTDLGYAIRITDTVTGEVKEYRNEAGTPAAAITDVAAFPGACRAG